MPLRSGRRSSRFSCGRHADIRSHPPEARTASRWQRDARRPRRRVLFRKAGPYQGDDRNQAAEGDEDPVAHRIIVRLLRHCPGAGAPPRPHASDPGRRRPAASGPQSRVRDRRPTGASTSASTRAGSRTDEASRTRTPADVRRTCTLRRSAASRSRTTYPLRSSRSMATDIVPGVTPMWRDRSMRVVGSISSR